MARTSASWSLAGRLAIWYAGSAFLLVLLASGFLHWDLIHKLQDQDDKRIADHIRVFQGILTERGLDLAEVEEELGEFSAQADAQVYVRLLDAAGHTLAESPGMTDVLPPDLFPEIPDGSENSAGADVENLNGRPHRVITVGARVGGASAPTLLIQAGLNLEHERDLLDRYRERTWIVLLVSLLACALVGHRLAHFGIRPIEQISEAAGRIRSTTLGERLSATKLPKELAELASTFNEMLDRLQESFDRLSQFSANIAHELRTPVHILRGEVEVCLGKTRSADEYRDVLESALEECDRLSRLIASLLFIARAEGPGAAIEREPIDVQGELVAIQELYSAYATERGVTLELTPTTTISAPVDRGLFRRAIGNLVENALAHSPSCGTVRLGASLSNGSVEVVVADEGAGIAKSDLPYVTDRCYRADRVRTGGAGLGLGLAIVKSVARLHGGALAIESEPGRGTRVRLCFPAHIPES